MKYKNKIDISYFAIGNRNFDCLKDTKNIDIPSISVKSSASNLLQRNYLNFDPGTFEKNKFNENLNNLKVKQDKNIKKEILSKSQNEQSIFYKYHPEYKLYKNTNEQIKRLNDYLSPIGQFLYRDCPPINTTSKLLGLEKTKYNILNSKNNRYNSIDENNNNNQDDQKIVLKIPRRNDLLIPNTFRLGRSYSNQNIYNKDSKSQNESFERLKYGSFLESKMSPEYLRNYDYESLKNIDQYYIKKNENLNVLSKFGNWITLRPNDRNRKHALEKIKHGTNETSIIAPLWMDINSRNKFNIEKYNQDKRLFKSVQKKLGIKDNYIKVTMLMDRDQKDVKPVYLRDSYEKFKILLNQQGKET